VNTGSLGKPKDGDPRACWTEVVIADESGVRTEAPDDQQAGPSADPALWIGVQFHRVAYDVAAVQRAMRTAGLPETLVTALARA
jgi:hypothetical protein